MKKKVVQKKAAKKKGRRARKVEPVSTLSLRFATAVKAERVSRGIGLREFARLSGVSSPRIVAIESGKHAPTLDTVEKIAALLGVDPLKLLGR